ncbi:MAG: M56 family metallopeptidase [Pseudomonadota bacterium]
MTVVDLLWHGLATTFWVSVLTIVVLAVRKPVAERLGARAAVLLWMIPLARLVMPTLPRTVPAETLPPAPATPEAATAGLPGPLLEARAADVATAPVVAAEAPALPMEAALPVSELAASSASVDVAPLLMMPTSEHMASFVLALWGAGAMLSGLLCWLQVRRWRATIVAEAQPTPPALKALIERAARRANVDRGFQVIVSAAADTPQLLGLKRPIVALPADFMDRFSADEQEMALMHEFVHLKRGDLVIMLATEIAAALQWFNPLTHKVRRAVRDDQEAACDETVRSLGVCRQSYAALLVKAVSHGRQVPALTLDHSIKDRIILMAAPISSPIVRAAVAFAAVLGSVSVAAATASYNDIPVELAEAPADIREGSRSVTDVRPRGDGSYWDRHRTSSRHNHLYTAYADHGARPAQQVMKERAPASDDAGMRVSWRSDTAMVLLSDPFATIAPPPDMPADMPEPPQPPMPEIKEREVDGGRWIFVPDEPDMSAFEESMKEFERRMVSWTARMEDFGAQMEAASDAVEDLAERCESHLRESDEPKLLIETIRVEGSSDQVRAICATGGMERMRSAEIRRFVDRQRLSDEERAYFRESIRHRG